MADAKRTKRVREDETLTLDEHIQKRRARLVSERLEVPRIRHQVEEMRDEAKAMTSRWQMRMRQDLLRNADAEEEECNIRENMSREHHFETMVVQYMQRYHKRHGPTWQARRKSDSIQAYVEQTGVSAQHKATIVDEYLTDIDQAPAKVAMSTRDECPRCTDSSTPLLVCPTRSIMTCSKCGYSVA